jgi:hypothetical protein
MTHRRPRTEAELVEFVRSIDVPAPPSLHSSVRTLIAEHERRTSGPARVLAALLGSLRGAPRMVAAAGALGISVLVLVLALSGGGGTAGLGLRQTAALTLLPATAPAPAKSSTGRQELAASVDGVRFPYWEDALGWASTGTRTDRVGGRPVTTVFYADHRGASVGYAIVGGLPAPAVGGGRVELRSGIPFRLQRVGGVPVVTWLRNGHLCVVSGNRVSASTLLALASWRAGVAA